MKSSTSLGMRTMLAIAAIALVLGLSGIARAQDATPVTGGGVMVNAPATINVTGTGTVLLPPDAASVQLGVTTVKPTLAEAQKEANTSMEAIIAALKAGGVAELDIQTSNYSVNIMQNYDQNGMPAGIIGYQVSNMVSVTVRAMDSLGQLLDDTVTAGANTIWGINFFISDTTEAAKQAREMAVKDAIQRATELATAAGGTLGRIVNISETSSPIAPAVYGGKGGGAGMESAVPIQTGSNGVSVMVSVTFELNS